MKSSLIPAGQENHLTPLRVIQQRCLDCCGGQRKAVRDCEQTACSLHPYRMGKRPKTPALLTPMQAIKAKCKSCCNGQLKEVRLCPVIDCSLYPMRQGKRPGRLNRDIDIPDLQIATLLMTPVSQGNCRLCAVSQKKFRQLSLFGEVA